MASSNKMKRKNSPEVVGKGLMRVDKSRTSPAMKAILLFIVIAMTVSFIPALASLFSSGTTGRTPAQYQADVDALNKKLEATPDDQTTLVSLGNTYFDWAFNVMQSGDTTGSVTYWAEAADAYGRAVEEGAGDSGVRTDYAVALYYSGDGETAIEVIEAVVADDEAFAPAWFNMGMFKSTAGDVDGARAAFEKYLEVDPTNQYGLADQAQQGLSSLGG